MPLTLTFELTDRDLEHFNQALAAARAQAGQKNADEIITAASRLLGGDDKIAAGRIRPPSAAPTGCSRVATSWSTACTAAATASSAAPTATAPATRAAATPARTAPG